MKRIVMSVCAALCCVVIVPVAKAQDTPAQSIAVPATPAEATPAEATPAPVNPWNGSWKVDPASMKYDGPAYTMATDPDGFTISTDGVVGAKIVCDAGQNKMPDGVMTSCTTTDSGYEVNSSKDGRPTTHVRISLSGDTKTMTQRTLVFLAQGSTYTTTTQAQRVSGGPGLAGKWKAMSFAESRDTGVISIKVDGDRVAFKETDSDAPSVCKLDGTPVKTGSSTVAIKPDGAQTLKVTYTGADGNVRRNNTFVLSADGTSMTETDVTPNPAGSTMTETFRKM